jgi:MacB-like periplasmic core domain
VVSFTIDPPPFYKPGMTSESLQKVTASFCETLQQRIRETPGLVSVALAQRGVLRDRGLGSTVAPAGDRVTQADVLATAVNGVTPDYFKTMGIPLLAGRLWTESFRDFRQKPVKVVVNQTFAQRYFPGADPIGRRFGGARPGQVANADNEIIGEVSDAKYRSLREPIQPTIFNLFSTEDAAVVVVVKTRVKPELLIQPIRQAIASFAPSMPIVEVETLAEEVGASASGERLTAALRDDR